MSLDEQLGQSWRLPASAQAPAPAAPCAPAAWRESPPPPARPPPGAPSAGAFQPAAWRRARPPPAYAGARRPGGVARSAPGRAPEHHVITRAQTHDFHRGLIAPPPPRVGGGLPPSGLRGSAASVVTKINLKR